jgi:hypothetical protein
MTDPSASRPVPGPGRPAPVPDVSPDGRPADEDGAGQDRFGDLDGRPVAEHVEVFEAEHDRLQSELGTIDRV